MKIVISNDPLKGQLVLTEAGQGGPVVLRAIHQKSGEVDHMPWDVLSHDQISGTPFYAATVVHDWACEACRSDKGIDAARRYLRQWPNGPQAEPGDIRNVREYRKALTQAALDLAENSPPLNQMSPAELCVAIRRMVSRLRDFANDSAHAYLLRLRISAAATLLQAQYDREQRKA